MMITPDSGRPSDVAITLPWFAIATVPKAAAAIATVFTRERGPVHVRDLRAAGGDPLVRRR